MAIRTSTRNLFSFNVLSRSAPRTAHTRNSSQLQRGQRGTYMPNWFCKWFLASKYDHKRSDILTFTESIQWLGVCVCMVRDTHLKRMNANSAKHCCASLRLQSSTERKNYGKNAIVRTVNTHTHRQQCDLIYETCHQIFHPYSDALSFRIFIFAKCFSLFEHVGSRLRMSTYTQCGSKRRRMKKKRKQQLLLSPENRMRACALGSGRVCFRTRFFCVLSPLRLFCGFGDSAEKTHQNRRRHHRRLRLQITTNQFHMQISNSVI